MTKAAVSLRLAALGLLAAAVSAPALAGPTPEEMKGESGIRFSETAGLGQVKSQPAAVFAGGESGRRADLTILPTAPNRKPEAPPSPTPPAPPAPKAQGTSLGTKLFIAAGDLAGAAATVGLVAAFGAAPVVLLGLGGAASAAVSGWKNGDGGWKLAKETAAGAVSGVAALALVGMAAGLVAGRAMERLFKR